MFSISCIFLTLYTTVLCFGGMCCFQIAADVDNITSRVQMAFEYEDTIEKASDVLSLIKVVIRKLKLQYDEI